MTEMPLPLFGFRRDHDAEVEEGFVLAGMLFVDVPKERMQDERNREVIKGVIDNLAQQARTGRLALDYLGYGWRDAVPENDEAILTNEEHMTSWRKRCTKIDVRIAKRETIHSGADGVQWIKK
jgi:hypothetical protein